MPRGTSRRPKIRRLRSIHRRMSFAAFERLPRRLGWKHEYYGGKAHIAPSSTTVTLILDLTPREVWPGAKIRPASPADAPALEAPFLAAFALAPEYADYPADLFWKTAAKYLQGFFGSVRGEWCPVSVLAEVGGHIVGAALVKRHGTCPLLDCVFVRPDYGRRGLATGMVSRVVQSLLALGHTQLLSHVMLANEPSLAWHRRFGFRELPDLWVASQRWRYYHSEWERHRELNDLPESELTKLAEQAAYWAAEEERLQELGKRDLWLAHPHYE